MRVVEKLGIPVVTGADSIDCIYDEHPLYIGKGGNVGDRPGNFAIQNSDLVLSLGSRLSFRQVGYRFTTWAREAYVIVNDIDAEELKKPTLHVDMPVHADVKDLLTVMDDGSFGGRKSGRRGFDDAGVQGRCRQSGCVSARAGSMIIRWFCRST